MFPLVEDQGDDGRYADGEDSEDVGLCRDDRYPLKQLVIVNLVVVLEDLAVLLYEGSLVGSMKEQEHKMCRLSAVAQSECQFSFWWIRGDWQARKDY